MKFKAALFLTACSLAHPAFAQDTVAASSAEREQSGDSILVTGTRIVRDGFQAPTPLTVLTREDINNTSPTNNIADFVNQLPQLAGSTKPANSRLNLSNGSAGINALSLRNLGEGRTLILLDGRRSVGSTIFGWVDINTIPQGLVDRVEVVTGGASAAYGSDAVGGVVNFVLNKKLEGLRVTAESGVTTYGDGFNYSGTVSGGTSFADGRGHIIFNGEVAHQDGIFEIDPTDREWNHTGYVRVEDPAWVASSTTPRYITTRRNIGAANSTPGGLITGSAGTSVNALRGLYFGQNGAVTTFDYGTFQFPTFTRAAGSSAPSLVENGSWQVNDSGRRIGLMPEDDRWGLFGRVSFEIADDIELFAEGSYNRQKVFFNAGPNLATGITYNTTGVQRCRPQPPVTRLRFRRLARRASSG